MALTTNLVAYYKMDGDATDSVGSADGTVIGATLTTGKINQGYSFEAISNDNITINGLSDISSTSNKTIAFWSKPNITADGYFFDCTDRFVISPFQNTVKSYAHYDGTSWKLFGSSTDVENGVWQFIVFVWSSSGTQLTVYKDGSQLGSTASVSAKAISGFNKRICAVHSGGGGSYNGILDEFGIWTRALTSTEVTELYNSGDGLEYPFTTTEVVKNALFFGGGF